VKLLLRLIMNYEHVTLVMNAILFHYLNVRDLKNRFLSQINSPELSGTKIETLLRGKRLGIMLSRNSELKRG